MTIKRLGILSPLLAVRRIFSFKRLGDSDPWSAAAAAVSANISIDHEG